MRSFVIAVFVLMGGGALLVPCQRAVLASEQEKNLLPPSLLNMALDGETKKLEQQLFLVSLGGLRTLVAAFLAVNAQDYFAKKEWAKLADRFYQVVALAPQNIFYWETGSYHMAYNASSSSLEDTRLRETERKLRYRSFLKLGRDFLREGIRNNPESWVLYSRLGETLSDSFRDPDYAAAAEAYKMALEKGAPRFTSRSLLYCVAQVPGREEEAYEIARKLFEEGHRVPSVECLIYSYQMSLNIPREKRLSIREIFLSPRRAEGSLSKYILQENNYPKEGVSDMLRLLAPFKNSVSWDVVPTSVLEKLSYYDIKKKHTSS